MNVLDLFSGIGGFSLGFERAGMKTIAFCEKDKYCQKVLRKHWAGIPIFEDITKLKGEMINETIDLVCGGFPCQPFSIAGKRKGKEDVRHLWPEMFRIIQETKPNWVVGENVNGVINLELEQVCIDLESEGYEVQPFIIPACAVNAPHRRDRVWIVAHCEGIGWKRWHGDEGEASGTDGKRIAVEFEGSNKAFNSLSNTSSKGLEGRELQEIARIWSEQCGFGGWDENWIKVATRLCGVDARVPARMDRLKCLGNSVVPQIVEIIGNYIMEVEKKCSYENIEMVCI